MLLKFKVTQTQMSFGQTDLLLQQLMNGVDQDSYLPTSQIFHKDIFNNKAFYDFLVTIHGRTNWH